MIKKCILISTTLFLLLTVNLFAEITNFPNGVRVGDSLITTGNLSADGDLFVSGDVKVDDIATIGKEVSLGFIVDSNACITARIVNKDGTTLSRGDFVMPDATGWKILRVKNNEIGTPDSFFTTIAVEGTPFSLNFKFTGTPHANDSAIVYGTKFGESSSSADTLVPGAVASVQMSTPEAARLWTALDSVVLSNMDDGAFDSVEVFGYNIGGVVAAITAHNQKVIGVVYTATIADNAVGQIVIAGRCEAEVEVSAASAPITPGDILTVNARGNAIDVASAADSSAIVGYALESFGSADADDSSLIWIEFDGR